MVVNRILDGANFPTCNATDTSIDTSSSWEIPMKILSTSIDHSRSKHHAIKKNLKNLLHFRQSPHFIRQLRRTTSQRQLEDSREWFDDDNEDSIGYVECSPLYMEGI